MRAFFVACLSFAHILEILIFKFNIYRVGEERRLIEIGEGQYIVMNLK